jgi:hypothetical protein
MLSAYIRISVRDMSLSNCQLWAVVIKEEANDSMVISIGLVDHELKLDVYQEYGILASMAPSWSQLHPWSYLLN